MSLLSAESKLNTYCSKRINFERIPEIAEFWYSIKTDHLYLEDVLLHEFLSNNIKLSQREREIAKECVQMVGKFYDKASKESINILQALNDIKKIGLINKDDKVEKVKYRRD